MHTNDVATVLTIDGLQQTAVPKPLAPGDALGYGYLLELVTAMRPDTKSAMVIGLGGGLAPRVLAMQGIRCSTVEIDPEVVIIARREFAFTGDVTVGDGRAVLARTQSSVTISSFWMRAPPTGFLGTCLRWKRCVWCGTGSRRAESWRSSSSATTALGRQVWCTRLMQHSAAAEHCARLAGGRQSGWPAMAFRRSRCAATTAEGRQRCGGHFDPLETDRSTGERLVVDRRLLSRRACLGDDGPAMAGSLRRKTLNRLFVGGDCQTIRCTRRREHGLIH